MKMVDGLSGYISLCKTEQRKHNYIYCYTVYWKEQRNFTSTMWYQKPFSTKKEAKTFAKSKKDKAIKLKPYIIRTTVHGNYFSKDVQVEMACEDHDVKVIKV